MRLEVELEEEDAELFKPNFNSSVKVSVFVHSKTSRARCQCSFSEWARKRGAMLSPER